MRLKETNSTHRVVLFSVEFCGFDVAKTLQAEIVVAAASKQVASLPSCAFMLSWSSCHVNCEILGLTCFAAAMTDRMCRTTECILIRETVFGLQTVSSTIRTEQW